MRPVRRPENPCFSSGPTAKRPGWSISCLADSLVGRSHRSGVAKARLQEVITRSRNLLGLPEDYRLGIVPASDTGAFEMAMWSMLGARPVDVLVHESFGAGWATDVTKQLKPDDVRVITADYGQLPDVSSLTDDADCVFAWNGTTSGVCFKDGDWIPEARAGLTFCDATSAAFAMPLPWNKLDVVTWSWQKVLGGEAQHGMIALSPRAVERLESYTPSWPVPKIFRMTKGGKLIEGIFKGETINTPSMIAVEDARDGLRWVESIGGIEALYSRAQSNLSLIRDWVAASDWAGFLAESLEETSPTSICLKFTAPEMVALDDAEQKRVAKKLCSLLEAENVAYDIGAYRDAPAGLRIWGGGTVEASDIEALLPWLDWAYAECRKTMSQAA